MNAFMFIVLLHFLWNIGMYAVGTWYLNSLTNQKKINSIRMNFECYYLRNEFNFWNVHGTMNTSGRLQCK